MNFLIQSHSFILEVHLAAVGVGVEGLGSGCVPGVCVFLRMYTHEAVCVSAHLQSAQCQVCRPRGLVFHFHLWPLAACGLRGVAVVLLTHG